MSGMRELMDRPSWMELAECRGMDPEMFFPGRGQDTSYAKAICRRCEVQAECLAYSMNSGEHHGIWGGFSERERRRLRGGGRLPPRPRPIEHGTEAGYGAHLRRGEPACRSCLEAHAAGHRERKARGTPRDQPIHIARSAGA